MLVITEVDKALVSLLATYTYSTERVQVDLDPPNRDWSARRSGPVLNLFLNDVREDSTKRSANMIETRNDEGLVVSRRPPGAHLHVHLRSLSLDIAARG